MSNDLKSECINNMSQFIRDCRTALRSEEHNPGYSADANDDSIATLKDKIARAEHLRSELEKLFYSV